jgi:hypothetical protein
MIHPPICPSWLLFNLSHSLIIRRYLGWDDVGLDEQTALWRSRPRVSRTIRLYSSSHSPEAFFCWRYIHFKLTVYNPSFFKNAIQIETVGRKSTWLMTSKLTRPNWAAARWITKLPELSSCGRMPVFWLLHKSRRAKPTSSSGIHFSTITSDLIQFNCCVLVSYRRSTDVLTAKATWAITFWLTRSHLFTEARLISTSPLRGPSIRQ